MPTKRREADPNEMVRTAIWLPRKMRDQLKQIRGERGMSEEIRRRLEASFGSNFHDDINGPIAELVARIGKLSGMLVTEWEIRAEENQPGITAEYADAIDWSLLPSLFKAFRAGVIAIVDSYEPKDTRPAYATQKEWESLNSGDDPEIVGRALARSIPKAGGK